MQRLKRKVPPLRRSSPLAMICSGRDDRIEKIEKSPTQAESGLEWGTRSVGAFSHVPGAAVLGKRKTFRVYAVFSP